MSTCGVTTLRTFNGDSNMEVIGIHGHQENGPGEINQVREAKGVETNPTPQAPMEVASEAHSGGDGGECKDRLANAKGRKDNGKGKKSNCGKLKNATGEQEAPPSEENPDVSCKKRKTRRGKPKHRKLKPYTKQPAFERQRRRSMGRQMKKSAQPPAPYNTTQFLMEDHSDLPDLEEKLAKTSTNPEVAVPFQKPGGPPRTRDSSFSIDSDEDYFYSSPEDEEEFLTKEFSSAYEDLHAERLSALSKSELIEEYVQLEAKLDLLTKRLRSKNLQTDEVDGRSDGEMAKKVKLYQQRIDDLVQQNEQLRRENESLRGKGGSSESSVDSESDSDSSSSSGHSGCSCVGGNASPGGRRRNGEARVNGRGTTDDSRERSRSERANGSATSQEIEGLPT
ncbi:protein HEXIM [Diachasma alloeum]|uniref:protein HEXIM n=1 Tax=Diachasma alloeum TaxID=454923 RepID=UPI000738415F|nr:protein HEXIM [Diachasma alloeum]